MPMTSGMYGKSLSINQGIFSDMEMSTMISNDSQKMDDHFRRHLASLFKRIRCLCLFKLAGQQE